MARRAGAKNRRTEAAIAKAEKGGEMPLEFLLRVMRAPMPPELAELLKAAKAITPELVQALDAYTVRRIDAAKAAAPYVHARLIAREVTGNVHHTHEHFAVSEVDSRINNLLGSGKNRDMPKTRPH
jgi:hypothetical protein